jgi:uncharacterized Zn finger protein (UPF0148 family)
MIDIKKCPHCGMIVKFSSENICPSCNTKETDPITEKDLDRIQRINNNDLFKNKDNNINEVTISSKRAIYLFYFSLLIIFKLLFLASRSIL